MLVGRRHRDHCNVRLDDATVEQVRNFAQKDGRKVSTALVDGHAAVAAGEERVGAEDASILGVVVFTCAFSVNVVDANVLQTGLLSVLSQSRNKSTRSSCSAVNEHMIA